MTHSSSFSEPLHFSCIKWSQGYLKTSTLILIRQTSRSVPHGTKPICNWWLF